MNVDGKSGDASRVVLVGQQRFDPGRIVQTSHVAYSEEESETFGAFILACLGRHLAGDWGDLEAEDKDLNDAGLTTGNRLVSVYKCKPEHRQQFNEKGVYIVTEHDRSYTTVMFKSDY